MPEDCEYLTPNATWCFRHHTWKSWHGLEIGDAALCPECGYSKALHEPWHPAVQPPADLAACPLFAATTTGAHHGQNTT